MTNDIRTPRSNERQLVGRLNVLPDLDWIRSSSAVAVCRMDDFKLQNICAVKTFFAFAGAERMLFAFDGAQGGPFDGASGRAV